MGDARRFPSDNAVKLRSDQGLGAGADLVTDSAFGVGRFAFGCVALGKGRRAQSTKRDRSQSIKLKIPHLSPPKHYPPNIPKPSQEGLRFLPQLCTVADLSRKLEIAQNRGSQGLAASLSCDRKCPLEVMDEVPLYVDATRSAVEAVPDQFGKRCDRLRARLSGKEIVRWHSARPDFGSSIV